MTTSGTFSFSVNRDQIIRMAMLQIRRLDEIEVPSPQDVTDCSMMLNMLVKQWMGKTDFAPGLKTFTRQHGHLFLSSTTGKYTLGPTGTGWTNNYVSTTTTAGVAASGTVLPLTSVAGITVGDNIGTVLSSGALYWDTVKTISSLNVTINGSLPTAAGKGAVIFDYTNTAQFPEEIETAFLRDITNEDNPLRIMTLQEYDFLPSKNDLTAISDPTGIYWEPQLGYGYLYTDVPGAQDVTKHIGMTYMTQTQDFTNPTDMPFYPQQWYLPLALGLAKNICPMYGATWTPLLQDNFTQAFAIARQKTPENSTLYFQCGEDGSQ